MEQQTIVVERLVATPLDQTDLREEAWTLALDQRAFGPGRLVVAFADADGRLVSLAHTARTEPLVIGLVACIECSTGDPAAAVAYCDEPVTEGPPPDTLATTFAEAREAAADRGVWLVDWFSCDDLLIRSSRAALDPGSLWWDLPCPST